MKINEVTNSVPLPEPGVGSRAKYGWHKLRRKGDSVLIEVESKFSPRVRRAAHLYARRKGLTFLTRTVPGGVRVWRVES